MDNQLVYKIIKRVIIVYLCIIAILIFLIKGFKPIVLGFTFGTIISILGFKLLHNTINKAVSMSPDKAVMYSTVQYLLRYIIYFVVLSVGAIADYLNFPATILGLLMVKFVILGLRI